LPNQEKQGIKTAVRLFTSAVRYRRGNTGNNAITTVVFCCHANFPGDKGEGRRVLRKGAPHALSQRSGNTRSAKKKLSRNVYREGELGRGVADRAGSWWRGRARLPLSSSSSKIQIVPNQGGEEQVVTKRRKMPEKSVFPISTKCRSLESKRTAF